MSLLVDFLADGSFCSGKYAGHLAKEIARTDRNYIEWAIVSREQLSILDEDANWLRDLIAPPIDVPPSVAITLVGLFSAEILPPSLPAPTIVWTGEQEVALAGVAEWKRGGVAERERVGLFSDDEVDLDGSFFALTGPAGSGKSTLVREIVDRFPDARLTAMTGKAALRLSQCAGRGATTLHSQLYYPPQPGEDVRFTRLRAPESSLIVVDEASMMGGNVFADCQRWAAQGVRFLFIGDSYQLPPVITGDEAKKYGEDYSVFSRVNGAQLQTVMRSAGGVLQASKHVRETGELCRQTISEGNSLYEYARERAPLERAVNDYLVDRNDHLLITWKNSTRMQANNAIRKQLGHDGPLPDDGEPVLIKKNGQSLMNGEVVTCSGWDDGPVIGDLRTLWMTIRGGLRVLVTVDGGDREKGGEFFDGQQPWVADWRKYHTELRKGMWPEPIPVTWAYCLTAHSAQGSEARRVTVFLNREDLTSKYFRKPTTLPSGEQVEFKSRWVYTAVTRSKKHTTMIVGE